MKLSWGNLAIAYLQLLHPVLTFGRLALLALADLALAEIILVLFRPYAFLANRPSLALFVFGIKLRFECSAVVC